MPGEGAPLRRAAGFRASDFADAPTADVLAVPGMIGATTQAYYRWLTGRWLDGPGAVVEVGTFLGSSSVHLAAGLARRGDGRTLHCFDRFEWRPEHADTAALPLRAGESFQPVFERTVRPVHADLAVTACDLLDLRWTGGPVRVLVLDAPKQVPEISATLAAFGDALLPGAAVVMEDFLYFPAYPLALVVGTLADRLALLHVVDRSHTVAVEVTAPLDVSRAQPVRWQLLGWSPAEADRAWDRLLDPLPDGARARLEPGRILHLHDLGAVAEARARLRRRTMPPWEPALWERLAGTHLHDRYPALFAELGLRRRFDPRRPAHRERARRGLRRRWRRLYLGSRRAARRALDRLTGTPPRGRGPGAPAPRH